MSNWYGNPDYYNEYFGEWDEGDQFDNRWKRWKWGDWSFYNGCSPKENMDFYEYIDDFHKKDIKINEGSLNSIKSSFPYPLFAPWFNPKQNNEDECAPTHIEDEPTQKILIEDCSECSGSGQYVGLGFFPIEKCKKCDGSGNA